MRLTPEEIEARRFRLSQNGYDCEAVDRFLAEIADALRSPSSGADPDEFGRLGTEIAAILRNARDSAGAIKAEAEGQAAALRSRAEAEAADTRKAADDEAEVLRTEARAEAESMHQAAQGELDVARQSAEAEAEVIRAAAKVDADAKRKSLQLELDAQREAAQREADAIRAEAQSQLDARMATLESEASAIRVDAEHKLAEANEALAEADTNAAARLAAAEREATTKLTNASTISAEADRRSQAAIAAEQASYNRLLAARDDLQQALDHLLVRADVDAGSVVDLTTAPAQVLPATSDADEVSQPPEPAATEPPSTPVVEGANPAVGPTDLDSSGSGGAGDPLLRMVRAAVGRAAEASAPDDIDREASAS